MVVNRILGIVILIIGFLILKYFPDMTRYQLKQMTFTGIFIGILLILIGIGLIIFG